MKCFVLPEVLGLQSTSCNTQNIKGFSYLVICEIPPNIFKNCEKNAQLDSHSNAINKMLFLRTCVT